MEQLKLNIKKWYIETYPTDICGYELKDHVTFEDMFEALDAYKDVYETIGISDSLVRERLFEKLSQIMSVDYDYIYEQWLIGA